MNAKERITQLKTLFGEYIFYYLLYWKKANEKVMFGEFQHIKKLYELSNEEYVALFKYATEFDLKVIKRTLNEHK